MQDNIVVKQESNQLKKLNKLIEKNRFRITKERAILHKKVATVDEAKKSFKVY